MTIFTRSQLERLFSHTASGQLPATDLSRPARARTDLNEAGLHGASPSTANLREADQAQVIRPRLTRPRS